MNLPEKSRLILEAIAKGQSYDQILAANPNWTYGDIFAAAADALGLAEFRGGEKSYEERLHAIQQKSPRAYSPWEPEEDEALKGLFASGKKVKEIAELLYRQPSAIKSRLENLNLKRPPPD